MAREIIIDIGIGVAPVIIITNSITPIKYNGDIGDSNTCNVEHGSRIDSSHDRVAACSHALKSNTNSASLL